MGGLRVRTDFAPQFEFANGQAKAAVVDSTGRIYIAGLFTSADGEPRSGVLRLLPDGTLDPTFRAGSFSRGIYDPSNSAGFDLRHVGTVNAIALTAEGQVLVAGNFDHIGGIVANNVARLHSDGRIDASFANDFHGLGYMKSLCVQPDGRILVLHGTLTDVRLVRLLPDGKFDASFWFGTELEVADPDEFWLLPDNRILVSGVFRVRGESTNYPHIRLTAAGSFDSSYFEQVHPSGAINDVALLPDGGMIVAGTLQHADGSDGFSGIGRLNADGSIDGPLGSITDAPWRVLLAGDGFVAITGHLDTSRLVRYDLEGVIDPVFNAAHLDGVLGHQWGPDAALAVTADGGLVVATFEDPSSRYEYVPSRVRRVGPTGTDQGDLIRSLRTPGEVSQVAALPDGKWLVEGDWRLIDGVPQPGLVRLLANGTVDSTFSPELPGLGEPGRFTIDTNGDIIVHVLTEEAGGYVELVRLSPDGAFRHNFGIDEGRPWFAVSDLAVQADRKIVATGAFNQKIPYSKFDAPVPKWIARANSDGTLDESFDDTIADWSHTIVPSGQNLWLGGDSKVQRLNLDGSADSTFTPVALSGHVRCLFPTSDGGAVVAGSFTAIGGTSRDRIARVMAGGSVDAAFPDGSGFDGEVWSGIALPDGSFVLGGFFSRYRDAEVQPIVRIRADGSRDEEYAVEGGAVLPPIIRSMARDEYGRLLVSGTWDRYSTLDSVRTRLVLLEPAAMPRIVKQPESLTVTSSARTTLSVAAESTTDQPLTFQWQVRPASTIPTTQDTSAWVDLPGATSSSYVIPSTQSFHSGMYRVIVSAGSYSAASDPVPLAVNAAPPSSARLLNLSTRGLIGDQDNILIPGFVIAGTGAKKLLIRAVGPTLSRSPFNLDESVVPNPRLTLKRLDTSVHPAVYVDVASNDDWTTNTNAAEITAVGAELFAFALQDSREAALLMDLAPGQYTVIAGDETGSQGIALTELYDADADAPSARLINISNRGFCGVGGQVMIPGFWVSAEGPRTFLIRVVGPRLGEAPFNVPGTMADPKLTIYAGPTAILENDDWSDNPAAATTAAVATQVSAFPLTEGSTDAALVVTLKPGGYTVVGSSADGQGTGVILAEIYVVP